MNERHIVKVAQELNIPATGVMATAKLLSEDSTVPFIARYRKEATGSLDEVAITAIRDRLAQLQALDERREAILKSLEERGLLTDELKDSVVKAATMSELEDIYLPFRPKRRTRATVAREKGLEPLALALLEQNKDLDPEAEAAKFIDKEKGVNDAKEALQGARDIIAEVVSEDADARGEMRAFYIKTALISSKVVAKKEEEGAKFRDYFDWKEPIAKAAGHRLLAMFRGEEEGFLKLSVRPDDEIAATMLKKRFVKGTGGASKQVAEAVEDGYKRLLSLSMEIETRVDAKLRAGDEAINVFSENLRELLMAPPLGGKATLAIDPGFRTGCKVACISAEGKILHYTAIFPTQSERQKEEAAVVLRGLCDKHKIEAIAIGNGTASREAEEFVRSLDLPKKIAVVVVNESGASVYSASKLAREEFPDLDVTVRGAISIGKRLMDPLAELVKIDPKSIGVGQYQHDVDQNKLKRSLDDVVVSCVNAVGVDINTASPALLSYVSGLSPTLAKNIETFKHENGEFKSRAQIKKVPRLGPKAFEQSAGFLRIRQGENPLDASAVHPENYATVEKMAKDLGCKVSDLMTNAELRAKIDINKYVTDTVGLPTLKDIMSELAKPGRDPRKSFEAFSFADVHEPKDLKSGMWLPGIVTNVTNFGAFVDVGVHQDGLVHVSQLSEKFVQNPMDVVKVNQRVNVRVVEVDLQRNRISLSMLTAEAAEAPKKKEGGAPARRENNRTNDKHLPKPAPKNAFSVLANFKVKS